MNIHSIPCNFSYYELFAMDYCLTIMKRETKRFYESSFAFDPNGSYTKETKMELDIITPSLEKVREHYYAFRNEFFSVSWVDADEGNYL